MLCLAVDSYELEMMQKQLSKGCREKQTLGNREEHCGNFPL